MTIPFPIILILSGMLYLFIGAISSAIFNKESAKYALGLKEYGNSDAFYIQALIWPITLPLVFGARLILGSKK